MTVCEIGENDKKYLLFRWDGGHLKILESKWNRLPQRKKNLIYMKAEED